jgi:hypothetical protein
LSRHRQNRRLMPAATNALRAHLSTTPPPSPASCPKSPNSASPTSSAAASCHCRIK